MGHRVYRGRELLSEKTPYWTEKIGMYKKTKYETTYIGVKPVSKICCASDNGTRKSFGYVVSFNFFEQLMQMSVYIFLLLRHSYLRLALIIK